MCTEYTAGRLCSETRAGLVIITRHILTGNSKRGQRRRHPRQAIFKRPVKNTASVASGGNALQVPSMQSADELELRKRGERQAIRDTSQHCLCFRLSVWSPQTSPTCRWFSDAGCDSLDHGMAFLHQSSPIDCLITCRSHQRFLTFLSRYQCLPRFQNTCLGINMEHATGCFSTARQNDA